MSVQKFAILPFNVAEPIRPALGRMLAHFVSEFLKIQPNVETQFVSYLTQVGAPDNQEMAFVNIADEINSPEFLENVAEQTKADWMVDGVVKQAEIGFVLTFRVSRKGIPGESVSDRIFRIENLFETLRWMITEIASAAKITLLPEFTDKMEFGTDNAEAFYNFLLGFDAVLYIQQAGPRVAKEFDISLAFDSLLTAVEQDPDFLGAYEGVLQLAQLAAANGVGSFEIVNTKLRRLMELVPDDWRAHYSLAEIYLGSGKVAEAAELYEKALRIHEKDIADRRKRCEDGEDVDIPPFEPALYTRLAMAQQQLGMVANAELNFRQAIALEGEQKPSMGMLANLLQQTGRGHEVPALWKNFVNEHPESPHAWVGYALSLMADNRQEEGRKAFEEGLERTDGSPIIKRVFAPFLSSQGEFDLAMDYYEDVLDYTPNDIPTNIEYAQTLARADRIHEVPDVLKNVLASEPDPDTRANTVAWLYEIEQPKRMESMQRAQQHLEKEEFGEAIAELEPLTGWMPDYWKLWAMLSNLYNKQQRFEDAERAATQVLQLFPGCEPAFGELSGALIGQGRAEEAYNILSNVLRARPNSAIIALNLAMAAKQTGRHEEAARLAKILREAAGPNNVELESLLSQIER